MFLTMTAFLFASVTGAYATPVYYTIFYAVDETTGESFTSGGYGTLSISKDGGTSFQEFDSFEFDSHGRAVARMYWLRYAEDDWIVRFTASFNESDMGKPEDTFIESTVDEFTDSLKRYQYWRWLTYFEVNVTYSSLPNIVDTAIGAGSFTSLVTAVQTAGLEEALRGKGPFTVFAPTNEAFDTLAGSLGLTLEEILALPNLSEILLYHVVSGSLDGSAVAMEEKIETLMGKDVTVTLEGENIRINDSLVVASNIEASNGIIHVIDAVLLPPELPTIYETAVEAGIFTTLVAALEETGLDEALSGKGPFTVFAPTDEAFEALGIPADDLLANPDLTNILLYHVVDGTLKDSDVISTERLTTLLEEDLKVNVTEEGAFINDAKIVATNIKAENGIIHIIDAVLIPEEMPDIVDTAIEAGQFNTLVDLLQTTGLDEVLRGKGPFTVFAPTDEAFSRLPKWLLRFLLRNPRYLEQILLYHVVPGDLDSSEVLSERKIKTVEGRYVYPRSRNGKAYINSAQIIDVDIEAENGTIHVINRVLIPWFRH
jgi:transforming growth factor-beta-induced protein